MGLCLQQPAIAVQAALADNDGDLAVGMSILNFTIFLGGTIFVTVSQTLLEGQLSQKLGKVVPNLNFANLTGSGATSLRKLVPADKLALALKAYNDSMRSIWYLGLALACSAFIFSFGLQWKSVKAKKDAKDAEASDTVSS